VGITRQLEGVFEGELYYGFVSDWLSLTASIYFLNRLTWSHQRGTTAALTAASGISLTEVVDDLPDGLALTQQ